MARQVQIIKGTTEQNDAFTGAEGVLTYDTETKNLRIHDGTTEGGFEIPSSAMGDYVVYWDSANATDHSHAKPGVSTPTDNGWYRLYKSGWVEQGGGATTNGGNPYAVSLPVEMADVYYNISILGQTGTDGYSNAQWQVMSISTASTPKRTTGFYGQPSITGYNLFFYWQVSGMSAQ